jgi:hypothetical protein
MDGTEQLHRKTTLLSEVYLFSRWATGLQECTEQIRVAARVHACRLLCYNKCDQRTVFLFHFTRGVRV